MCPVLSLSCTLVPCLQGHCCVCHSCIERSLQVVCLCPVLVFDLRIKHEVVLGQGWGYVVRCWGSENCCGNVTADPQHPESKGCGDFPCISGEGINVMKMNVIKIQWCKIFSDCNSLLLVRLVCLSLPEVPAQERKKHSDPTSCRMCYWASLCTLFFIICVCEALVPLMILLQVSQYLVLFLIWSCWSQEAVFENLSFHLMKIIHLEINKKVGF